MAILKFFILAVALKGLTEASGILPDGPLNGTIGGSVMFTTSLTEADGPFPAVTWNVNTTILIINYLSGSMFIPPDYENRITFFPSTLSLELRGLTLDDGGEYSVTVFSGEGGRIKLDIYEKISGVSIKVSTEQIIEGSSVTLTCEASGSSPSRKWKKDGSDLSLSENVTLSEDNKVLTFKAVNKDNSGEYVCLVSNPFSSSEAKFTFIVNYGPQNVQIEGKDKINENDQIKLMCSAESTPSATFTWRLNGSEIIGSSAEFLKEKAQRSDSGTYTCEALNTVTKKQATAEHELRVQTENSSGCSAGCIAGIVVGCLVVVTAASAGGYSVYKKRHNRKPDPPPPHSAEPNHIYEEMSSVYENVGK
ncbi:carcinoembryonic antigen-related cell adhesion molecule 20-like isoform X2 [Oryzias latipes]|uniref:carcinoembryonic antigen-related cell adhesion molecule 20-like isoform X2 n=1 Tax=Oryzias latipes TaxID=8090 RepID=UPI0005CC0FF9|nr:carcinoembryonic antigen-related cell adhesion molecule 20-like isoform X2 [Oryzias latipes]